MNRDQWLGIRRQIGGHFTEKWGRMTGDRRKIATGRLEILSGKVQARFGAAMNHAEKLINKSLKAAKRFGTV